MLMKTKNLIRITLVCLFIIMALPEIVHRGLDNWGGITYTLRMALILAWLWWLTVDHKN